MDTKWYEDPVYHKMCDCPEIQDGHEWEAGDNGYWPDNGDINVMYIGEYMPSELGEGHIWLPLQHQLQEMVTQYPDDEPWVTFTMLRDFVMNQPNTRSVYTEQFKSWEQLWLAFVMKELHNKTWDGNQWVTK